jgi:hypothetical protein
LFAGGFEPQYRPSMNGVTAVAGVTVDWPLLDPKWSKLGRRATQRGGNVDDIVNWKGWALVNRDPDMLASPTAGVLEHPKLRGSEGRRRRARRAMSASYRRRRTYGLVGESGLGLSFGCYSAARSFRPRLSLPTDSGWC